MTHTFWCVRCIQLPLLYIYIFLLDIVFTLAHISDIQPSGESNAAYSISPFFSTTRYCFPLSPFHHLLLATKGQPKGILRNLERSSQCSLCLVTITLLHVKAILIANEQKVGRREACETLQQGVCNQFSTGFSNLMIML